MMQPEPQGAEEQAPAEGAGGGASQLITGIQSDMKKLGALLEKAGAAPELLQAYAANIQDFEGIIEKAVGGSEEQGEPGPQAPSVASPEAGSNPNARPM